MTLLFNIIFIITSILLGVGAVMLIVRNIIDINKLNNPKTILKNLHPELEDVQTGDELMTVNFGEEKEDQDPRYKSFLLYTSPSPRDPKTSRMPSSA